jgi:hypothetical protein
MSNKLILNYNLIMALIEALILKLWAIAYNLEPNMLLVIILRTSG